MANFRRFAFLVEDEDEAREEYATADDGLTAEEAVERCYDRHPDKSIVKVLRGQVPDDLDLSPPSGVTSDESEGDGAVLSPPIEETAEGVAEQEEGVNGEDLLEPLDEGDSDDFSVNGWLDNDYQDRADAVFAGGLDDYLDEIEEAETSDTVVEAVQERREALEGDE